MNSILWRIPPECPQLNPGEVHIWRGWLQEGASLSLELLADNEIERGLGFLFEQTRYRFWRSRIFLRRILAGYLSIDPTLLYFREGTCGKLYLAKDHALIAPVQFNVSHSQNLVLFAVTMDREIGIDTEWIDPKRNMTAMVKRFFSEPEQRAFQSVPMGEQAPVFYRQWTRKEAALKARGGGGFTGISRIKEEEFETIINLEPAPNYAAALALLDTDSLILNQISYFQIDG